MGHLHIAKEQVFKELAARLDKNPIGAPLNETLMKILYTLYTEEEAKVGSKLPLTPVTLDKAAAATGLNAPELKTHLNNMADKGLVIDVDRKGKTYYMLSPLVVGFFEYTFMRVNEKLPMNQLAHLFEEYHKEKGVAEEFFGADTKVFQTWAYESVMPGEVQSEILTYERASEMIRDSGGGALTMCYCRHQTQHLGKNCDAPIEDICTSLGGAAEWLIKRGFARPASVDELLRVLEWTEELGLVHLADNVKSKPAYICHCCGCCCGVLRAINEHEQPAVHPSNFLPIVNEDKCNGCGVCVERCHINAIEIKTGDENVAVVKQDKCLGCGVCITGCKKSALGLVRKNEIRIPPKSKKEQMLSIAREKGKLRR